MEDGQPPIADLSFESALARLEEIVRRLERGDAPLDDMIRLFEEGNRLRAHCQARLDDARMRIDQISASVDGRVAGMRPFDEGG